MLETGKPIAQRAWDHRGNAGHLGPKHRGDRGRELNENERTKPVTSRCRQIHT
jgi:hypothetical protein